MYKGKLREVKSTYIGELWKDKGREVRSVDTPVRGGGGGGERGEVN